MISEDRPSPSISNPPPMPPIKSVNNRPLLVYVIVGAAIVGLLLDHPKENAIRQAAAASKDTVSVSNTGQGVVDVRTEPVRLQALENKVDTTGLVSFPADDTVKIAPRVQGRVSEVFVRVGDHVTAGQPIAVLESSDAAAATSTETQNQATLRLAKDALDRADRQFHLGTPEVTSAQAILDQAKAAVAFNKDALDKIKEQSKIGGFTQQPLETAQNAVVVAQSNLTQSQADLDTAQRAYDRMVKLVGIGVNAQQDLETAGNTLAHAKANVEANQKVLELSQEAVTREKKAFKTNLYADQAIRTQLNNYQQAILQQAAAQRALDIAQASLRADLETAQTGYRNAVAAEEGSRAALALIGNPTRDGTVRVLAPRAGVVVERDVNPGQVVDQSQMTPWQMFVVSNNRVVWVEGDLYEKDVSSVQDGQPVTIHVDAYPNKEFTGHVLHVSPTLDPKTHAVKARAEISNPNGQLKDGMFAEMTILTGHTAVSTVVSLAAVQHDADTDFVYVASSEPGKYTRRNIRLGAQKAVWQ